MEIIEIPPKKKTKRVQVAAVNTVYAKLAKLELGQAVMFNGLFVVGNAEYRRLFVALSKYKKQTGRCFVGRTFNRGIKVIRTV